MDGITLLEQQIEKGRKVKCSVSGMWFYESQMKRSNSGAWVLPEFERHDHERSQYESGPGWERRF
jgi:hypothetical protein